MCSPKLPGTNIDWNQSCENALLAFTPQSEHLCGVAGISQGRLCSAGKPTSTSPNTSPLPYVDSRQAALCYRRHMLEWPARPLPLAHRHQRLDFGDGATARPLGDERPIGSPFRRQREMPLIRTDLLRLQGQASCAPGMGGEFDSGAAVEHRTQAGRARRQPPEPEIAAASVGSMRRPTQHAD